ncbi:MAG: glycosyltransferase [Clostridium sp.]|nr:glycosyltransferase [Clostridium sp.]
MDFKVFRNRFLIWGTALTTIVYLVWRIFFTIPFEFGLLSVIFGIILLIVEIGGMIESSIHFASMSNIKYPEKPVIEDENLYPNVDVFIATYNEPVDLLYKTVNGCVNMDYPDKNKVHIYICDDSNRPEMHNLAKDMGIGYITRTEHKDAKAGNLNNALSQTSSPLIVTFDADMIPMHDFLTTCIPYFIEDLENADKIEKEYGLEKRKKRKGKIGFVQTPQSFYNPDLFQYNLFSETRIPNEQDYFYRDIQVSRNKTNSVIYGGSNTVLSREALNDIGGFYTKVITEDFATGMLIQSKGYKCFAIDEIHASGLSPQDLKSLIKQRERWGRGCIQTGRKLNIIFRRGLNFKQKLSYLSAIFYWYSGFKRLVYIISPLLYGVFGIVVVKCTITEMLIFWLPMYLFNNSALKMLSKNIRNVKWTNVYETILFPSLLPTVILESVGIAKNKFAVTKKEGAVYDRNYQIRKAVPHMILWILSLIGILNIIGKTFTFGTPGYSVLFFWLVINFYNITMAIFFMLGREVHRTTERVYAKVQCELILEDEIIKCITNDISEGGIGVSFDFPIYIPYEKEFDVRIKTDRYKCTFKGQISNIQESNNQWKYGIKLKRIDENDYKNMLNILYDREPVFPKTITKNSGVLDDIKINIKKRKRNYDTFNRKLPRIELHKKLRSIEAGKVEILNFNYEYVLIKLYRKTNRISQLSIPVGRDIILKCELGKNKENENNCIKEESKRYIAKHEAVNRYNAKSNENIRLYVVENYRELAENKDFIEILFEWIEEYRNNISIIKQEKKDKRKKSVPDDELDEMSALMEAEVKSDRK